MELKQAGVVCLIAFFAATLVVLIAGALDNRAAEPLKEISKELAAIRKAIEGQTAEEVLMVYYFHVTKRCATCNAAEKMTRETLDANFAAEMKSGKIVLETVNMEEPDGSKLALSFDIGASPAIGLAIKKGDKMREQTALKAIGGLIDDKPAFEEYLSGPIQQRLQIMAPKPPQQQQQEKPLPDTNGDEVTVPDSPDEIPLP